MFRRFIILKLALINLILIGIVFIFSAKLFAVKDTRYCASKKKDIDASATFCDPSFSEYYEYFTKIYKPANENFKIMAENSKNLNDTLINCGEWLKEDSDATKMPETCKAKIVALVDHQDAQKKPVAGYVEELIKYQKNMVDFLVANNDCLDDNERKILTNLKTRTINVGADFVVYEDFPLKIIDGILTKMRNTLDYWLQKCKNDDLKKQLDAQDEQQKRSMEMQLEAQQCDRNSKEYEADRPNAFKNYYKTHPACAAQDQYNEQAKQGNVMAWANLALFGFMALPVFKEIPEMAKAIGKGPSAFKAWWRAKELAGKYTSELTAILKEVKGLRSGTLEVLGKGIGELSGIKGLESLSVELKGLGEALKVIEGSKQVEAAEKIAEFIKGGAKGEAELIKDLKLLKVESKEIEEILAAAKAFKPRV